MILILNLLYLSYISLLLQKVPYSTLFSNTPFSLLFQLHTFLYSSFLQPYQTGLTSSFFSFIEINHRWLLPCYNACLYLLQHYIQIYNLITSSFIEECETCVKYYFTMFVYSISRLSLVQRMLILFLKQSINIFIIFILSFQDYYRILIIKSKYVQYEEKKWNEMVMILVNQTRCIIISCLYHPQISNTNRTLHSDS